MKNRFIESMQQVLLCRCRETRPTMAEFYRAEISRDVAYYLEESNTLCLSNREVGMLMLDELGINPLSYEDVLVQFDLDVFAGCILNGDSEDGITVEWFDIEAEDDVDGDKYLRCMYRRCRNVKEI